MFVDTLFFEFVHSLYEIGGGFFTPFFRFISFLGEKGWFFILLSLLLMLRKKTRWIGVTIFLAILFAGVSEMILKPLIGRQRPYLSAAANLYKYWQDVGSIEETGFSMPSGHTIATASFFFALLITIKKESRYIYSYVAFISIMLMIMSRCYFMHHHLTDCLLSIVISFIMAHIAKFFAKLIYSICKKHEDIGIFGFAINFDFFELFAPKRQ